VPLGASGGLWGPLGASGGLWGPLGASGGLWGPLGASGGLWVPLGASGCLWVPLGASGCLWVPLGASGCLWVPLGASGRLCRPPLPPRIWVGRYPRLAEQPRISWTPCTIFIFCCMKCHLSSASPEVFTPMLFHTQKVKLWVRGHTSLFTTHKKYGGVTIGRFQGYDG
jgi:hypothetical protein